MCKIFRRAGHKENNRTITYTAHTHTIKRRASTNSLTETHTFWQGSEPKKKMANKISAAFFRHMV